MHHPYRLRKTNEQSHQTNSSHEEFICRLKAMWIIYLAKRASWLPIRFFFSLSFFWTGSPLPLSIVCITEVHQFVTTRDTSEEKGKERVRGIIRKPIAHTPAIESCTTGQKSDETTLAITGLPNEILGCFIFCLSTSLSTTLPIVLEYFLHPGLLAPLIFCVKLWR